MTRVPDVCPNHQGCMIRMASQSVSQQNPHRLHPGPPIKITRSRSAQHSVLPDLQWKTLKWRDMSHVLTQHCAVGHPKQCTWSQDCQCSILMTTISRHGFMQILSPLLCRVCNQRARRQQSAPKPTMSRETLYLLLL